LCKIKRPGAGHQWFTCNPSYFGGRDQEVHNLKPAQANSSVRPYLKKTLHKNRAGELAEGEGPKFKPQYKEKKPLGCFILYA
jgi:hypothetical protein